jgi:urease accessory protein
MDSRAPKSTEWLAWNAELSARKVARESRDASSAMGRRFLRLAANISGAELLIAASEAGAEVHLAPCFGLAAGVFGIDPRTAAAAYLQQSMTGLVSACQRLLPLGQTQAHHILWNLKPAILRAAEQGAATPPCQTSCFTPLIDLASARHASLYTRLFMS